MKRLRLIALVACTIGLFGCAGATQQSAKVTIGTTVLAMHDLAKTGAETADILCAQKVIKPEPCLKIKTVYVKFRERWPLMDDALIVYLNSPATDPTATLNFQTAHDAFMLTYSELLNLFIVSGAIKEVK